MSFLQLNVLHTLPQQALTAAPKGSSQTLFQPIHDRSNPRAYIPVTAMVTVQVGNYEKRARVLLDTTSGLSIIISRFANALMAKKICVLHSIRSLCDSSSLTSEHVT